MAVPSLEEEKAAVFDYDRELRVSERARRALDFMRKAVEKYGHSCQPLWPVVPSLLYGAFLAGEECDAHVLVITFDATATDGPWVEVVGVTGQQWTCWARRSSTRQRPGLSGGAGVPGGAGWLFGESGDPGCRQAVPAR